MPRQCQFPVQFSDNRRCYRASTPAGFVLCLALVAVLAGFVGVSHAAPAQPDLLVGNASGLLPAR